MADYSLINSYTDNGVTADRSTEDIKASYIGPENAFIGKVKQAPEGKWLEIQKNHFIFKTWDGGVATIYPNVTHYADVKEWSARCYRLTNGVRIEGCTLTFKPDARDDAIARLEQELYFLSSIKVPNRGDIPTEFDRDSLLTGGNTDETSK